MSSLDQRCAIVSGAAQGLGAAFARRLAAEGAGVLLFDVRPEVEALAAELARNARGTVVGQVADVSRRDDVEAVVANAVGALGGVDLLVNNAGTWRDTPVDSPWQQALEDWDHIMDTNLKGLLMLSRACVPHMKARGGGDIVHVSTYYVLPARSGGTNPPNTDLYNASKWALNGFTDAWSKYLAKDHIRVNALCMGATDTPMLRGLFDGGELPADLAEVVMAPEQIAQQLVDLLADGRTGENIGAWVGHPVELGPIKPAHRRITG
jgi:NAD(P)-dependent dehydrogenase (short-subunit alcohol dehydrogenase family)